MGKILIATVSRTGTTDHAASLIEKVLQEQGHETIHKPIDRISSLEAFDLIVIGAPINGMSWHPEAIKFVESNTGILAQTKVALYLMSYMLDASRSLWNKRIHSSLDKVAQQVNPISIGYFKGKIDAKLPGPARFIFGLPKELPLDRTEDTKVSEWAEALTESI